MTETETLFTPITVSLLFSGLIFIARMCELYWALKSEIQTFEAAVDFARSARLLDQNNSFALITRMCSLKISWHIILDQCALFQNC